MNSQVNADPQSNAGGLDAAVPRPVAGPGMAELVGTAIWAAATRPPLAGTDPPGPPLASLHPPDLTGGGPAGAAPPAPGSYPPTPPAGAGSDLPPGPAGAGGTAPQPVGHTTGAALRRVVAASVVGTALEWYDFFVYGTAAALVFGDLFFPGHDPTVQVLASFATFGVAFLFRPLGGFLFGRLGDRLGRRSALVLTTLLMGLATGGIGLLPTHRSAGMLAPVLLVLTRICQGLGAGAEFSGASTLLAEHAPPGRRGYYTSFVQTGVQIGLLGASLAYLSVGLLGDQALRDWGWRVPFLASFLLILVSLYVRLHVAESPVFRDLVQGRRMVPRPVTATLRHYSRSFLIGVGGHICDTAVVYVYSAFMITYLTHSLDLDRSVALTGVLLFSIVVIVLQPVYGRLADRIGRRPLNLFSVVFTAIFTYPLFALIDSREPVVIWSALIVATALGFAPMVAVQPIFYAELFGAGVRYTGFAASREVGAAVSGFSPLLAAALLSAGDGRPWLVAGWIVLTALISLVAFLYSRETRDIDITAVHLDPAAG